MTAQPYVEGIASNLSASQIVADEDTISVSVLWPDRWFLGDLAVVTTRDGRAFAGPVEGMDVCTGELTIRAGRRTRPRT
jgi:hypothetical protein